MEYQESLARGRRRKTATLTSLFVLTLAQLSLAADPPVEPKKIAIAAEVYTDPRPVSFADLSYPPRELRVGEEGWVYVRMMVDPHGKPYELEVAVSTGNKAFEKQALESAQSMKFVPALLGGKPVDGEVVQPFFFRIDGYNGVTSRFAKPYNALVKAVQNNDQAAAQAALSSIQARNLYENAAFGMAKFAYAKKWGTEEEQLQGLTMAVAGMTDAKYLSKDTFVFALRNLFLARVQAKDFVGALETWKTLQPLEKDPAVLEPLQTTVKNIEAFRTDPRPYSVPGKLTEGVWSYRLFKDKFHIKVITGHVSQIKLYCQKKYVLFLFDPALEYKVEEKFGKCSMVVVGDGGTSIELVQKT